MTTLNQRSFSGGELSPFLYARVDISKYVTGLRTCRNFMVLRHGGVSNRPGSTFVCEVNDSSKAVRIIRFKFNSAQTYVLEFGDGYMRVIRDGVQLKLSANAVTAITQANPAVVTSTAHGYSNGDEVLVYGVVGMGQLNNRNFKVSGVTSNTFQLRDMDGVTNIDSTGYGVYVSGGFTEKVYQITTPYLESELFDIKYVQSADVITLVHPSHPPMELTRFGNTNWTLTQVLFAPGTIHPTSLSATSGGGSGNTVRYQVTAVDEETSEESLPGTSTSGTTLAITNANPAVVTIPGHGFLNGEEVLVENVDGMTELNNLIFTVANVTTNTFELEDVDSTTYGVFTSGGFASLVYAKLTNVGLPTPSNAHTVTWSKVSGAREYNIYRETNGLFGLIGIAIGSTFKDVGITPDITSTPPNSRNPFVGLNNYPSSVTYIQQRLCFANTNNDPEKIYMSRIGNFKNFTVSSPLQADDAITFNMAGAEVNAVKHMIDLSRLVILTTGGEWSAASSSDGPLTALSVYPKQQSYNGSGDLKPLIVSGSAVFQQARGSIVRDLGFDYQVDGYAGNDLTIFSAHLFDGYTMADWDYQQIPHSVIWVARDDGTLLGLTYVREQQLLAWHRHDFSGGSVESVAVIPEGNEDILYLVINRTINGQAKRYIEKFTSRTIADPLDIKIMDSNLTYDGRNSDDSHTMTLSGGTTWNYLENLTLTSSQSTFLSGDIGNAIHLYGPSGEVIRCTIHSYTSATVVTIKPHKTVPLDMRSVGLNSWDRAVDQVSGLWHLEGQTVAVFADGFVVASPNNSSYVTITVTNGTITLDKPYGLIHVGLPITSDLETLDIDTANGETLANKSKNVQAVTMYVESSRGVWVGARPPEDSDDPLEGLREYKVRNSESPDSPVSLKTENISVTIDGEWNNNGRVFVRQVDPIPLTILSVAPSGKFPFRGGV